MLNIKSFLNLCHLHITRTFKKFFKNFSVKLSILFVIFSFILSLFFTIPSIFSRLPVFPYFIETLSLPLSYEFEGKILLIDETGQTVNQTVTIFIGGYSVETYSGDTFTLNFSSEVTDYVYVIIEYKNQFGAPMTVTKKIETNGNIILKRIIEIYV